MAQIMSTSATYARHMSVRLPSIVALATGALMTLIIIAGGSIIASEKLTTSSSFA